MKVLHKPTRRTNVLTLILLIELVIIVYLLAIILALIGFPFGEVFAWVITIALAAFGVTYIVVMIRAYVAISRQLRDPQSPLSIELRERPITTLLALHLLTKPRIGPRDHNRLL